MADEVEDIVPFLFHPYSGKRVRSIILESCKTIWTLSFWMMRTIRLLSMKNTIYAYANGADGYRRRYQRVARYWHRCVMNRFQLWGSILKWWSGICPRYVRCLCLHVSSLRRFLRWCDLHKNLQRCAWWLWPLSDSEKYRHIETRHEKAIHRELGFTYHAAAADSYFQCVHHSCHWTGYANKNTAADQS